MVRKWLWENLDDGMRDEIGNLSPIKERESEFRLMRNDCVHSLSMRSGLNDEICTGHIDNGTLSTRVVNFNSNYTDLNEKSLNQSGI